MYATPPPDPDVHDDPDVAESLRKLLREDLCLKHVKEGRHVSPVHAIQVRLYCLRVQGPGALT